MAYQTYVCVARFGLLTPQHKGHSVQPEGLKQMTITAFAEPASIL